MQEFRRLQPDFTLRDEYFQEPGATRFLEQMPRLREGFRKAGLPE